jgi:hypothetical protein
MAGSWLPQRKKNKKTKKTENKTKINKTVAEPTENNKQTKTLEIKRKVNKLKERHKT